MIKELGNQPTFHLYFGLKDKDKMKQLMSKEEFIEVIKSVCLGRLIAFSVSNLKGAYITEKGTYVEEESLELIFIGASKDQVLDIAKELKEKLNQECIIMKTDESFIIEIR